MRLHVRERAEFESAQPAWILLHGLAVSHRYLMPTAAALAGGPMYVPDLPGFGLSDKPARVFDPADHADTVAAWMDAAGIAAAYVLGNSFGCQVAVELAVRRPDLVAALVLVGPTVDPAAPTAGGQIRRWLRDLLSEDPRQAGIIAADVRDAGPRRILGTLRHSVQHDMRRRLREVTVPTLVMRGEHDPIAPRRWISEVASLVRDGSTAQVPRAAHNAITTAGDVVAAYSTRFVARHARAGHDRGEVR